METIANLSLFVAGDDANKMMNVFNFNTKRKRVEAVDNRRIGTRSLENQKIITETENPFDTVKLHVKCLPVFKKIMDKNQMRKSKYIRIRNISEFPEKILHTLSEELMDNISILNRCCVIAEILYSMLIEKKC